MRATTAAEGGAGPNRMTASRKALLMVSIVVLVAVLLAALGEGLIRLRHWSRYGNLRSVEDTFHVDAATGLRVPVPNAVQGGIRIDSLGFRSPELVVPKPASTVRLAFLGSSTTFCAEVSSNEATWPHLVWERLQAAFPATRMDYLNAGIPGYGADADLRNLERRVRPLQPDVIVIYEAPNDLSADTYERARRQGLVAGRTADPESWLSRHSLFWFLLSKNLTIARRQAGAESGEKLRVEPHELSQNFRRRLTDLVRASQATAPVVAVATFAPRLRRSLSRAEQRGAAVTNLYYMPYMSIDGLIEAFEEYNRVIREVAHDTGGLLIEGEERVPPDGRHYTDSVHFTDAGSRVMADRVFDALVTAAPLRDLVDHHRANPSRAPHSHLPPIGEKSPGSRS